MSAWDKDGKHDFPVWRGVYQSRLAKVPRTEPAALDRGEQQTAEKISAGTAPGGSIRRPTDEYNGLVRQMHWGLRRAGAEFEGQMARFEAVDQKAMARAAERERAQKRAFCPDFLNTSAWMQNGGEEDNSIPWLQTRVAQWWTEHYRLI